MTVAVIGGGLAGTLLALELRACGLPVLLCDAAHADQPGATAFSYGAVAPWAAPPTPLGRRMRQSARRWDGLQRRHGSLGWCRRWLRVQGAAGPLPPRWLPLPCGQVDTPRFQAAMPALLERRGVQLLPQRLAGLARQGDLWRLELAGGGGGVAADVVVLAAGAGSRRLWPALDSRLRVSWAGVLELETWPVGQRRGQLLLPGRFERLALERRAATLSHDSWVVDGGLVPWGRTGLLGQISLVRPEPGAGPPPDPAWMERRLREGLATSLPDLAQAPGRYRQAAVAFCSDGQPLLGPVPAAAGLWQFCGFSAAFAQVPVLAPLQAAAIAGQAVAAAELARLTAPG